MRAKYFKGLWIVLGVVFATGAGAVAWHRYQVETSPVQYRQEAVRRADLTVVVNATGTIEPEEVVDVGAQVVGMVQEFGVDPHQSGQPIDFLSQVDQGTVLARIDDAIYRARFERASALVEQSQAQLEQAQVNVRRAETDVVETQAKLRQAERDWARAQRLRPTQSISETEYDAAQTAYEVGKAAVEINQVAIEQQRAAERLAAKSLAVAQADLKEAQQNLAYTVIRSPVQGVIVDRRVNIGQTVVSSLNAPSLFLIAKDLKRLQVWASVNEADVGQIRPGQTVRFTVDTFPREAFVGTVKQIRLNATMTQNVVTYTVVVDTDNTSGRLMPYLTANVQFEADRRLQALLVPNAALRWSPLPAEIAPDYRNTATTETPESPSPPAGAPSAESAKHEIGTVWLTEGRFVRPVAVRLGQSDGIETEIVGGELGEGARVVVGEEAVAESGTSASPFSPQMFGGGRR